MTRREKQLVEAARLGDEHLIAARRSLQQARTEAITAQDYEAEMAVTVAIAAVSGLVVRAVKTPRVEVNEARP